MELQLGEAGADVILVEEDAPFRSSTDTSDDTMWLRHYGSFATVAFAVSRLCGTCAVGADTTRRP